MIHQCLLWLLILIHKQILCITSKNELLSGSFKYI